MSDKEFTILGHKAEWKIDSGNFRYYHPIKLTPNVELHVINKIEDDHSVMGPFAANIYIPVFEYQKCFDEDTKEQLEKEILEFMAYLVGKFNKVSHEIIKGIDF